jgi:hypothetical protein
MKTTLLLAVIITGIITAPTVNAAPAKCEAAARNGIQAVLDSPVCSGAPGRGSRPGVPNIVQGPTGAGIVADNKLVPDDDANGGYHVELGWKPNPRRYAE